MSKVPVYQWQPTTAQIAERAGIEPAAVVRFDHNTSPCAPEWAIEASAEAAGGLNEYPAADYRPLREAAAGYTGLDPDWVVPGAGIDEMILIAARAFLGPGLTAVTDTPAYAMYRIATAARGAELIEIERRGPGFEFPRRELVSRSADLTWLCTPHNPIGGRPPDDLIEEVIDSSPMTILDAAYAEFAGDRWAPLLERHPGLIVLHTLSKAFGLAGIRVGYALAHPEVAARLHALRPPGSVSSISAAVATRALADPGWAMDNAARIEAARGRLAASLRSIGIDSLPSSTNFLLCPIGPHARSLADRLMDEGLVVRTFPAHGPLAEYLRFTVRTDDQHARLLDALERNQP